MKVISLLNQAVTKALECTYFFDVFDELDADEEKVNFQASVCKNTFVEDPAVSDQARQYGNACNSFLRSAACSYQAVVLHQDCTTGEPIEASYVPATQPEQIISATNHSPTTVIDTTTTTERQASATSDPHFTAVDTTITTDPEGLTSAAGDPPTTKLSIIILFSYTVFVFIQCQ